MKLRTVKTISLFLTLIPLVCLIMYARNNNPALVSMALVSVGAQFMLRRTFWICPHCKNRLPGTVEHRCPHCGRQIET